MKAILMSIQSKWLAKIIDGDKSAELRKRFPKDYRGWVYLYCTKAKPYLLRFFWRYFMSKRARAFEGKKTGEYEAIQLMINERLLRMSDFLLENDYSDVLGESIGYFYGLENDSSYSFIGLVLLSRVELESVAYKATTLPLSYRSLTRRAKRTTNQIKSSRFEVVLVASIFMRLFLQALLLCTQGNVGL